MSSQDLSRFNVLITRPANQQAAVIAALEKTGAGTLAKALIKIDEAKDNAAVQEIKNKIQQLDQYDVLLFVSSNAAHFGGQWIDSYWPQFPIQTSVIAMGPTTASAIKEHVHCEVMMPSTGVRSEDVLAMPQLQDLAQKKIAIFRGNGGRELLRNTLLNRGAQVDYIEVYSRSEEIYPPQEFLEALNNAGINAISANSVETLLCLQKNLSSNFNDYTNIPVLVPSIRVAKEAAALGFKQTIDCAGADSEALVAGLARLADTMNENLFEED